MKNLEKKYEFFDVTADIGFTAFGNTLNESFENAALAMFNVISNTENIRPKDKITFSINSEDEISLLYDFLEEILFYHETKFMLFSKFNVEISKIDDLFHLDASIEGEEIDWNLHKRGSEIKAITYHLMNVSNNNNVWQSRAILDL